MVIDTRVCQGLPAHFRGPDDSHNVKYACRGSLYCQKDTRADTDASRSSLQPCYWSTYDSLHMSQISCYPERGSIVALPLLITM